MSPSASVFIRQTPSASCAGWQHCPTANTTYICELQSLGLGPLRSDLCHHHQGAWGLGSTSHILSLPTLEVPPWGTELDNTTRLQSLQGFLLKEGLGLDALLSPP